MRDCVGECPSFGWLAGTVAFSPAVDNRLVVFVKAELRETCLVGRRSFFVFNPSALVGVGGVVGRSFVVSRLDVVRLGPREGLWFSLPILVVDIGCFGGCGNAAMLTDLRIVFSSPGLSFRAGTSGV